MNLQELKINEEGVIKQINIEQNLKRRILDLGLVPGTKIIPLLKNISGNPVAYEARGSLVAIRNEEATKIIVEKIKKFDIIKKKHKRKE